VVREPKAQLLDVRLTELLGRALASTIDCRVWKLARDPRLPDFLASSRIYTLLLISWHWFKDLGGAALFVYFERASDYPEVFKALLFDAPVPVANEAVGACDIRFRFFANADILPIEIGVALHRRRPNVA